MKPSFGIFTAAPCTEPHAAPAGALLAVLAQLGFGLGGLLPPFDGVPAGGDEALLGKGLAGSAKTPIG